MKPRWIFFDRLSGKLPEGTARLYAFLLLASSLVIGLWLFWQGADPLSFLIPAVAGGLVLGRFRLFTAALPILLVVLLFSVNDVGPAFVTHPFGPSETLICVLGLTLIVSGLRFMSLVEADASLKPSSDAPFQEQEPSSVEEKRPPVEFLGLFLMVVGSHVTARFWFSWMDTEYGVAVSEFGLYPEALLAIKLALSAFVLFVIADSAINFVQWRRMGRLGATMRLQHQFWQWCHHEQRLVARVQKRLGKK